MWKKSGKTESFSEPLRAGRIRVRETARRAPLGLAGLLALFCGIATSVLARLCLSYLFYTYVLYFDAQNHIGVPTSIKLPSKS